MITLLCGLNSYAVNEKLAQLRAAFVAKNGTAGLESYNAEQLQASQLTSLLGGATLFAESRMVVVKGLADDKLLAEALLGMYKAIPDEVHLVLVESQLDKRTVFYKTLKKEAEFTECNQLGEAELVAWVQSHVKNEGGTIDSTAARLLVNHVGIDQSRLMHEIAKLLGYSLHITAETIKELVEPNSQDTVFQLLDLSLAGRAVAALDILDNLERAHEDPFQVANMLIWQAHILSVVFYAGGRSSAEVAKDTKVNPFVIQKSMALTKNFSRAKLNQIIDVIAGLDVTLKTTSTEPWRVIEQTILAL